MYPQSGIIASRLGDDASLGEPRALEAGKPACSGVVPVGGVSHPRVRTAARKSCRRAHAPRKTRHAATSAPAGSVTWPMPRGENSWSGRTRARRKALANGATRPRSPNRGFVSGTQRVARTEQRSPAHASLTSGAAGARSLAESRARCRAWGTCPRGSDHRAPKSEPPARGSRRGSVRRRASWEHR